MKIKEAKKFVAKQITDLEQAAYMFENIVQPRYETDKKILATIKDQYFKIQAVEEKIAKGLDIPDEELMAIPEQFR